MSSLSVFIENFVFQILLSSPSPATKSSLQLFFLLIFFTLPYHMNAPLFLSYYFWRAPLSPTPSGWHPMLSQRLLLMVQSLTSVSCIICCGTLLSASTVHLFPFVIMYCTELFDSSHSFECFIIYVNFIIFTIPPVSTTKPLSPHWLPCLCILTSTKFLALVKTWDSTMNAAVFTYVHNLSTPSSTF